MVTAAKKCRAGAVRTDTKRVASAAGGVWGRTRAVRRAKRETRRVYSRVTRPKAKGKGNGKLAAAKTSTGLPREPQAFTGLVQQRIDSTLRAITSHARLKVLLALRSIQSFGG